MPKDPMSDAIYEFECAGRASTDREHDRRMHAGRGLLLAAAIQRGLGPGDIAVMTEQIKQATS